MANRLPIQILLVIPVILGLWLLFGEYRESRHHLKWVYQSWWEGIREGDWDYAYQRMSPAYRERVSPKQFYRDFYFAGDEDYRLHHGARIESYGRSARIFPGDAMNDGVGGPEYHLIRLGNTWFFTGKVVEYEDRKQAITAGISRAR